MTVKIFAKNLFPLLHVVIEERTKRAGCGFKRTKMKIRVILEEGIRGKKKSTKAWSMSKLVPC